MDTFFESSASRTVELIFLCFIVLIWRSRLTVEALTLWVFPNLASCARYLSEAFKRL